MFRITSQSASSRPLIKRRIDDDEEDDDIKSDEDNVALHVTDLRRDDEDSDVAMDDDDGDDVRLDRMSMLAMPGQHIADKQEWMRGHGTYVHGDQVVASVAGSVERVNKLVSVKPLRTRYRPEVGDLVIGRIAEVGPRRWKVEAHAAQNAVLMLSSINLPDGVQASQCITDRRKLESDELQMRTFFQEGDLLVAEVQAFFADGAMSLHTRSLKYGKLKNGTLVIVPPSLILRLKSHFHSLPYGVDLIIGLNGYIWVSKTVTKARGIANDGAMDDAGFGEESNESVYSSQNEDISPQVRLSISRTALVISILSSHCVPISADLIAQTYQSSFDLVKDDKLDQLTRPDVAFKLLKLVATKKRQEAELDH
ncbi:Exosome complex component rrp4 [Microbotryomycetes sp. JL201]|nr:Exosome complex component rrp4 [Microbotryomycetes sp. JL201]